MADKKSIWLKALSWLLIFSQMHVAAGCYYYTYMTDSDPTIEKLDKLKNSPNYIIVHNADQAFSLKGVRVDQQAQTISGTLLQLTEEQKQYLETKPVPGSANRYEKRGKNATPDVINEVHFYIKDIPLAEGETITLSARSIEKVEVYDPDTGATTASFIFGGLGIALGVLTVIVIIVLLTKSSCPFVYVNNGSAYVFAGEIYSGAIFKCIERDDYLLLPHAEPDQALEIKIANKLKEEQYINQIGILQVSHPAGTIVLPDRFGKVHLTRQVVPMMGAKVDDHDVTHLLQKPDSTYFSFNAESGEDVFNDVILTFPKPAKATEGHLVMNAKNSLWGDYVFGEFTRMFGSSYESWIKKQNKKSRADNEHWAAEQGLAMKVFVESMGEWKAVDTVDLIGPLAFRDFVVPLDLSAHEGDTLRVKLSAGFMLWDLDYAGMDYSADTGMEINYIEPSIATTHTGDDAVIRLLEADDRYLIQKSTGDEVNISFPVSSVKKTDAQVDYILHSRGYYQHIRDYTGAPQVTTLLTFKDKGRFSQFSKEKYDEMNQLLKIAEISASIEE